jgi:hypothetical protein
MSDDTETDYPQDYDQLERAIRRTPKLHMPGVATKLRALGYLTSLVERNDACLNRSGERPVGAILLCPYSSPQHWDHTRPLIWRWHVDHHMVKFPLRSYRELSLECSRDRDPYRNPYWTRAADQQRKLELSCLPSELSDIAAWLPAWIDARDRGEPHPSCNVAMSRSGDVLDYAWTASAAREMDAWQQAQQQRELARQQQRQARERRQETDA